MWVGALRMSFLLRQTRSLKDKRRVYQQIRDRVLSRFDVAVSQVESPDSLGQLVIGVAAVGGDRLVVRGALEQVASYVDSLYLAPIARQEISVERFSPDEDAWIPSDIPR